MTKIYSHKQKEAYYSRVVLDPKSPPKKREYALAFLDGAIVAYHQDPYELDMLKHSQTHMDDSPRHKGLVNGFLSGLETF